MSIIENIPSQFQKGFDIILNLDDNGLNELQSDFSLLNESYNLNFLKNELKEKKNHFPIEEVKEVISALTSISRVIHQLNVPADKIFDDIYKIIETGNAENIEFKNQNKDTFIKNGTMLINNEFIIYYNKAINLITSNQNTFSSSKIITDLRPIFGKNIEENPKALVLVHDLSIQYRDNQGIEPKTMIFSLDSKDIQTLKEAILRAEKKESSLKNMVKNMDTKLIEIDRS